MKKKIPLFFSFLLIALISFFWDFIKIPYDENNLIIGEYFYKKHNPLNDTIRFLIFIILPVICYLILFLKINNKDEIFNFKINHNHFLKNIIYKDDNDPLKVYSYILIFVAILEFLTINFSSHIHKIDVFHHGTFLVPPMNYLNSGEFFKSTLYDYGFFGNNLGLFFYYLFGFYTQGSIIFMLLIFILFAKIALILISKNLVTYLNFDKNTKIVFFLIITFFAINLPDYNDLNSYFSPRVFVFLFFVYFLSLQLVKNKENNFYYIFLGPISILSLAWWFDIGIYINALTILLLIFFLIYKNYSNLFISLCSIFLSWFFLYLFISPENFSEIIIQLKIPFSSTYEYILGVEYKKPFSSHSARWTKSLLIIYFNAIILINLNFKKIYQLNFKLKLLLNLFFISSLLLFKSALMRSDGPHLKSTSGIYTYLFAFIIVFFIIYYFKNYKFFFKYAQKKKLIAIFFLIFSLITISSFSFEKVKSIKNFNPKKNILNLVEAKDEVYLTPNLLEIINYYKSISKNDNCIQILSDDIAFSYLLKKRTCTQFYIPSAQIIVGVTEKEFINQLAQSEPEIILYDSANKILSNEKDKKNMPNVVNFIEDHYEFHSKIENYIFYKKKL